MPTKRQSGVSDAVIGIREFFRDLDRSLERLASTTNAIAAASAKRNGGDAIPAIVAAKKRVPSPQLQAAWRLQGRYMGTLKSLSKSYQALVKRTYEEKGVRAAIKLAEQYRGRATGRQAKAK